jgi:hypothetical protein
MSRRCTFVQAVCSLSVFLLSHTSCTLTSLNGRNALVLPVTISSSYSVAYETTAAMAIGAAEIGACVSAPAAVSLDAGSGNTAVEASVLLGVAPAVGAVYEICSGGASTGFHMALLPTLATTSTLFVAELRALSRVMALSVQASVSVPSTTTLQVALLSTCAPVAMVGASSTRLVTARGVNSASLSLGFTTTAVDDYLTANPSPSPSRRSARLCVSVASITAGSVSYTNDDVTAASSTLLDWGVDVRVVTDIALNGYRLDNAGTASVGYVALPVDVSTSSSAETVATRITMRSAVAASAIPFAFALSSDTVSCVATTLFTWQTVTARAAISETAWFFRDATRHTPAAAPMALCLSPDAGATWLLTRLRIGFVHATLGTESGRPAIGLPARAEPSLPMDLAMPSEITAPLVQFALSSGDNCNASSLTFLTIPAPSSGTLLPLAGSLWTQTPGLFAMCIGGVPGPEQDPTTTAAVIASYAPTRSASGVAQALVVERFTRVNGAAAGGTLYHERILNPPLIVSLLEAAPPAYSPALALTSTAAECNATRSITRGVSRAITSAAYAVACPSCASINAAAAPMVLCVADDNRTTALLVAFNASQAAPLASPSVQLFNVSIDGLPLGSTTRLLYPVLDSFNASSAITVDGAPASDVLPTVALFVASGRGDTASCAFPDGSNASRFLIDPSTMSAQLSSAQIAQLSVLGTDPDSTGSLLCYGSATTVGTVFGTPTKIEVRRVAVTKINAVDIATQAAVVLMRNVSTNVTLTGSFAASVRMWAKLGASSSEASAVQVLSSSTASVFVSAPSTATRLMIRVGDRAGYYDIAAVVVLSVTRIGDDTSGTSASIRAGENVTLPLGLSPNTVSIAGACIGIAAASLCTCRSFATWSAGSATIRLSPPIDLAPATYALCLATAGGDALYRTTTTRLVLLPSLLASATRVRTRSVSASPERTMSQSASWSSTLSDTETLTTASPSIGMSRSPSETVEKTMTFSKSESVESASVSWSPTKDRTATRTAAITESFEPTTTVTPSLSFTPFVAPSIRRVKWSIFRDDVRFNPDTISRRVVFEILGTTIDTDEPKGVAWCVALQFSGGVAQPDGWTAHDRDLVPRNAVDSNRTHFWISLAETPSYFTHWTEAIDVTWHGACLVGPYSDRELSSSFDIVVDDSAAWGLPSAAVRILAFAMLSAAWLHDHVHRAVDIAPLASRSVSFFTFLTCAYPSTTPDTLFADTQAGVHGALLGDALVKLSVFLAAGAGLLLWDLYSATALAVRDQAPATVLARVGLPSVLLPLAAVLTHGMAAPALVIVSSAEAEHVALRLLCAALVAVVGGWWLMVCHRTANPYRRFGAYFTARVDVAGIPVTPLDRLRTWLLPIGAYEDDDLFDAVNRGFVAQWGAAFRAHRPDRRWWLLAELALVAASAIMVGMEPRRYACDGLLWGTATVNGLYLVGLLTARPCLRASSAVLRWTASALLLIACAVALVAKSTGQTRASASIAVTAFSLITAYAAVMTGRTLHARHVLNRLRRQEEHTEAQWNSGGGASAASGSPQKRDSHADASRVLVVPMMSRSLADPRSPSRCAANPLEMSQRGAAAAPTVVHVGRASDDDPEFAPRGWRATHRRRQRQLSTGAGSGSRKRRTRTKATSWTSSDTEDSL